MNGQSFTPRIPDKMNENMEFPGATGEDIEWMQDVFVETIFKRIAESRENRSVPKEDKGKVSQQNLCLALLWIQNKLHNCSTV